MARIPDTDIERLKNEVSVERLVEASGIELKKSGKDKLGKCPFHEDATPSLVVTPAKNLWHCFGCGTGGDPIAWVMKLRGISFRHAVELLRTDPSLAASPADTPVKRTTVKTLPAPVTFDADDSALLKQTVDYYHTTLKHSPEALAYLQARGLDHPDLIEHFQLGYANRTLGLRLPEKTRKAGADVRARLEKIGIYRESGHEHFNGSIIVPIMDPAGTIHDLYGRKIRDDLRKGTPKHLYLAETCRAGTRGVWNEQALTAEREIILCEALIDAMTFWCAGYRNVTASYGTEGFTDDHLAAFKAHGTERVLIAYDHDDAGERAADKLAQRLMAEGIECYRIQFPKDMDANDYALKVQPASKSLGILIRKAQWLGKGQVPQRSLVSPAIADLAAKEEAYSTPGTEPSIEARAPAAPTLPASPLPPAPAQIKPDIRDNEINLSFGEGTDQRRYRVRGHAKNLAVDVLKINLLTAAGDAFHVDTLDLYSAKQRAAYVSQASMETGIDARLLKTDLGRVLLALEQVQDEQIQKVLHPEPEQKAMPDTERDSAMALLKSPDLLSRILADFDACGLVGEKTNKLVAYLAAVSRKLAGPLAIVVQSSSAAGKSSLMDAVLAFVPEEERVKYSAMTGQSLFYMGETNLKHKILAICEEEGASRASYALKLLQSDGELTMASTGKDPVSGNLITQAYRVEGPVMIFLTTTAIEIDEELLNRCIVLSVDEGREQTEAIHHLQRQKRTLQGLQAKQDKQRLIALHQNAQRLLRPLAVVNPYADQLTFMSDRTRTRRDHEKYLTLIDTIALLHQHQRPIKTIPGTGDAEPLPYLEVTADDIASANRLAHDVLGRSLDDLPPQTRRLLAALVEYVKAQCEAQQLRRADLRLTRKEVRAAIGWGDTQLRIHLDRLVQMEYLLAHREGNGGRFVYELLYDGDAYQTVHLSGLLDPDQLKTSVVNAATTAKSRGQGSEVAGGLQGGSGPIAAPLRTLETAREPMPTRDADESDDNDTKTHVMGLNGNPPSYPQAPVISAVLPLAARG